MSEYVPPSVAYKIFTCLPCGFKSTRLNDYTRHLESNKHKKNEALAKKNKTKPQDIPIPQPVIQQLLKIYKCLYCGIEYSNSSALSRHKKVCVEKSEFSKEKEIELLKQQLVDRDKMLHSFESIINTISSPAQKENALSYFNFLHTNFPNTPALETTPKHDDMLEAKTMSFIEVITMYYNNGTLINFIGDYIIKLYKKEEPKNQSMWSTDISRLTYIISESCKAGENTWAYDKKGIKIKKIVIDPALNYIRDELIEYLKKNGGSTNEKKIKNMLPATKIIPMITSGVLSSEITKYIAPVFHLKVNNQIEGSKELNIKQIETSNNTLIPKDKEEMYESDESCANNSTDESDIEELIEIKPKKIVSKKKIKPIKTNKKTKQIKKPYASPQLTEREKNILKKHIEDEDEDELT